MSQFCNILNKQKQKKLYFKIINYNLIIIDN